MSTQLWKGLPALHQVDYDNVGELLDVLWQLRGMDALVPKRLAHQVAGGRALAAAGRAFLIRFGDCASLFAGTTRSSLAADLALMRGMAAQVTLATGRPVQRSLRTGPTKPRGSPTQLVRGATVPSFFGEAINGIAAGDRTPNAKRLLDAWGYTRHLLELLAELGGEDVWIAYEALHLPYLAATTEGGYSKEVPEFWFGARTVQAGGAHLQFASELSMPIGVKVGPSMDPGQLAAICRLLNRYNVPGHLTLIPRLGVERVDALLPPLVEAVIETGVPVAWVLDPMHGNTIEVEVDGDPYKTRLFEAVARETLRSIEILAALEQHTAGVMLEATAAQVTECLGGDRHPVARIAKDGYTTLCDPRLNRYQTLDLAIRIADTLER